MRKPAYIMKSLYVQAERVFGLIGQDVIDGLQFWQFAQDRCYLDTAYSIRLDSRGV